MNNYTVYRHVAPNGKMYVGITKRKPEYRWANGKGYANNKYFTHAIKKYGWDNFTHEILLEGLTKEQAELAEQIFIAYWDLTNHGVGYNINHGGQVVGTHSEETRKKLSKAKSGQRNPNYGRCGDKHPMYGIRGEQNPRYGMKHSEESKLKMSNTRKGKYVGEKSHLYGKRGKDHPRYGKPCSEITKRRIAESSHKKMVAQIDKDTGDIIAEFASISDAWRLTHVPVGNISKCCSGERNIAGGFCWRWV